MNSRNRYSSNPTFGAPKRTTPKKTAAVPEVPAMPNNTMYQGVDPHNAYPNPYGTNAAIPQQPVQGNMPYGYQGMPVQQPTAQQPLVQNPMQQGYMPQQQGYTPQQAYPQQGMPNQAPNPYGQQPYMPEQNPYGQPYMPDPNYTVLPPQGVQKPSFLQGDTWVKLLLLGGLPLLFIATLLFPAVPMLKWVFVALTIAGLGGMWFFSYFAPNAKTTLSLVYIALLLLTLVTLLANPTSGGQNDNTTGLNNNANSNLSSGTTGQTDPSFGNGGQTDPLGNFIDDSYDNTPTQEPPASYATSEAAQQLDTFFYLWQANKLDDMLKLCAPSWSSSVKKEPKVELFGILANRIPSDYAFESITGTDADSSRTITCTAMIDKQNNRPASKFRFQVMLLKENGAWYVAPQSLSSNDAVVDTTDMSSGDVDQALIDASNAVLEANATNPVPTVTPKPDSNTKLYYNSDGGKKYHIQKECKAVNAKYFPLASFSYGDLNTSKYKSLTPCTDCNAPQRP